MIVVTMIKIIVRRKEEELTGPASETGAGIRGAAGVMTGIVTDFKWAEVCGRLGLPLFFRIGLGCQKTHSTIFDFDLYLENLTRYMF